jgi:hypothetical protein
MHHTQQFQPLHIQPIGPLWDELRCSDQRDIVCATNAQQNSFIGPAGFVTAVLQSLWLRLRSRKQVDSLFSNGLVIEPRICETLILTSLNYI